MITTLSDDANCNFIQLVGLQISVGVDTQNIKQKGIQGQLKLKRILNRQVTVICWRFFKNTYFYGLKHKKIITAIVFSKIYTYIYDVAFFKQEFCQKITRKKVFKHPLGFDQESVRKLLILISEDSSIKNNVNDFGVKISIIYSYREYFSVSKNHIQMLWVFNSHRADRADTGKRCLCYMKLGQSAAMIFQI